MKPNWPHAVIFAASLLTLSLAIIFSDHLTLTALPHIFGIFATALGAACVGWMYGAVDNPSDEQRARLITLGCFGLILFTAGWWLIGRGA